MTLCVSFEGMKPQIRAEYVQWYLNLFYYYHIFYITLNLKYTQILWIQFDSEPNWIGTGFFLLPDFKVLTQITIP